MDEFLHFYLLRRSKDPGYREFKPWGRSSRLVLDSPLSLRNQKTNFFFISDDDQEFTLGKDPDDAPKLLRSQGTLESGSSFCLFSLYAYNFLDGRGTDVYTYFFVFIASVCPCLKKRYYKRVERVKHYLEIVKDFDELIYPQSLFCTSLDQNLLSTIGKTLRSSRKVSLPNHHLYEQA